MVRDPLEGRGRHDAGTLLQAVIEPLFKDEAVNQDRNLQNPVSHKAYVVKPVQLFFSFAFSFFFNLLGFRHFRRHGIQFIIQPALGHQFIMRALFGDDAFMENQDLVRILDGGEPVRDNEGCSSDHQFIERILHDLLAFCIESGCRFIEDEDLEKWKYMKGAKTIERTSKTGYSYTFSEGPIAFPDPLDRPGRTMLTSEGTKNRSSHAITDPKTGKLRILLPEECERMNGFPTGWTDTGMPKRQRYFIMGNALVVPLITQMGKQLLDIL